MVKVIDNPLDQYVADLFAPEDDVLRWIQQEADRNGLPEISIRPDEGRALQFFARSVGAKKIVEIGTLAGYSGVWLARALPADGKMWSLEKSGKHAAVSRASFARAGLSEQVEVIEGDARDSLARIASQGPFDFVFIDAEKPGYVGYLAWAVENLRSGGMVCAHNALIAGKIIAPENEVEHAMVAFNKALAEEPRLFSTIISMGDGFAVGIKV